METATNRRQALSRPQRIINRPANGSKGPDVQSTSVI